LDEQPAPRSPFLSNRAIIAYLAFGTAFLHLIFHRGYGYFRDELYFIACAEHLDWGYVDQPPLVAVVAWLSRRLLGDSLFALRFVPALAGGLLVWLTGAITRALGGRRYAQVLACVAVIAAPIYVGTFSFLSTDFFQPISWMACAFVAILIFKGGDGRLWLLFGLLAGLGLEAKHAMLFFGLAFFLGLLLTSQRKVFLQKWIWLGGLVALLVFLPNLLWEYRHGWPTYELLSNIKHSNKNAVLSPVKFFLDQILLLEPLAFPLWLTGLAWFFFSRNARPFRVLGWTYVIMLVLFVVLAGKVYYLSPAYPLLLAAGAVMIEVWAEPRGAWLKPAYVVLLLAGGAVLAPFAKPILPVETFIAYEEALHITPPRTETHRLGKLPQQYADMFGWPEMAATVAGVYNKLSPEDKSRCAIFGQNYGQAGAIDFFGRKYGLPKALSGHQNYFLWGPRNYTGECVIVLDDRREILEKLFDHVEQVAVVHHDYAIPYENDRPVHLCRGLHGSLQELWPKLKVWI
jgi:hypothetical protein